MNWSSYLVNVRFLKDNSLRKYKSKYGVIINYSELNNIVP